ncbi:conserved hypothetical protein [Theileria equi strain WA]|uniref:NADP-dependent oxidoreductase domain-containing protein n=1 Tax=Theileria equi strain WA TaxID=1537102 RepID=L1LCN9_THEEQ|nr:conserved hypothetical protein [Theileria equi strain WA]EKX72928.1 conserved hypothetical protein [Theileria equi strain WA]|eukprot:XP_004832380.1 conserved hypothetical protein [Theileria equi strain WA]
MCNVRRYFQALILFPFFLPRFLAYKRVDPKYPHITRYKQYILAKKPTWGPPIDKPVDDESVKEFFDHVFSNPIYETSVTLDRTKTPSYVKNNNTLKGLGNKSYDKILEDIRQDVDERLSQESQDSDDEISQKDSLNDSYKINLIRQIKRGILQGNLRPISSKKNVQHERLYKSKHFTNGMHYRKLGETDFVVSELCLGTSMFDNPELIDSDHAIEIMEHAYKRYGINYFDTCEYDPYPYEPRSYLEGHHKTLNTFLKGINRQNIIISGRISSSNLGKPKTSGRFLSWVRDDILAPPNLKTIEGAVDKLLESLGTDYLDILSFVYPYRYVPLSHLGEDTYCWSKDVPRKTDKDDYYTKEWLNAQIEALNILVSKGKIRSVGLSNDTIWGMYEMKYHSDRKFKLAGTQQLYNLLHRNEVESSGMNEASLKEHLNCPIIAYGILAGGILTGKYLNPERVNPMGADKGPEIEDFGDIFSKYRSAFPEDYGHLDFGPSNARCNIFPDTFHTHRTVWCQHATAEYLKLARTHGMTLSQLSMSWVYSRPFIGFTIIGPRTIGQLHESMATLSYPVTKELEDDIHEIFLRYRAPTMGGPQILTHLDEFEVPISQNDHVRYGSIPIWSGGSHWNMEHIPSLDKLKMIKCHKDQYHDIKMMFGLFDKPNDSAWPNFRCWVERLNEGLPGEYFAVKESHLLGWNTMKFSEFVILNKTPEEFEKEDTTSFHFYWKNGKVYVGPTTKAIYNFYKDKDAVMNVMKQREREFWPAIDTNEPPEDLMIWSSVDIDLVYKRLMEMHGINALDEKQLEKILNETTIDQCKLLPEEKLCEKFAYLKKHLKS